MCEHSEVDELKILQAIQNTVLGGCLKCTNQVLLFIAFKTLDQAMQRYGSSVRAELKDKILALSSLLKRHDPDGDTVEVTYVPD